MSNQVILFFMLGLFFVDANAQLSINPSVTATTGNYFGTPGSLEVSYTVGEMTAVTTAGDVAALHITQGFHQPEEMTTGLFEQGEVPLGFYVYPNPTSGTVWLSYEMPEGGTAVITLTDLNGKTIETLRKQDDTSGQNMEHFDVSRLSAGNYLLGLQFTTTGGKQYFSTGQFTIHH